jgi:hypothetical protein
MDIKKHAAPAVIAALVGALAGAGSQHLMPAKERIVEKQTQVRVAASKHAWPDLTQDETIAIGEKLSTPLKGVSVGIFCNDSSCDDLAHDLDDAMQIANVGSSLDRSAMPLGYGFAIVSGPNDDRAKIVADAIKDVTAGKLSPDVRRAADVPAGSLLIAIGNRPR